MPAREEIRDGLIDILDGTETAYTDEENRPRGYVDKILTYLHSQGVVIKADKPLPENPFDKFDESCGLNESARNGFALASLKYKKAGYVATIPIIEK